MRTTRSADGTTIAYETLGTGAPVILIGGAFCDRRAKASGTPLAELLAPHATAVAYDRRGRGDSTDTPPYAIDRELDDLAALIAAVGGSAALYGISSGALLAIAAAAQGLAVTRVAVYDAPIVLDSTRRPPEHLATELAELVTSGRRGDAAELFLTRVVGVPAPAIAGMRHAPMWRGLEALAHTLAYDVVLAARAPALLDRAAGLRTPLLVLAGAAGPAFMHDGAQALVATVPGSRFQALAGQTHDVDPRVLAPVLAGFFENS
ncbi:MAG: alpha/beta hydrolase [Kofleriaceae bacterium]